MLDASQHVVRRDVRRSGERRHRRQPVDTLHRRRQSLQDFAEVGGSSLYFI
jgi:hypothetical protein